MLTCNDLPLLTREPAYCGPARLLSLAGSPDGGGCSPTADGRQVDWRCYRLQCASFLRVISFVVAEPSALWPLSGCTHNLNMQKIEMELGISDTIFICVVTLHISETCLLTPDFLQHTSLVLILNSVSFKEIFGFVSSINHDNMFIVY